MRLLALLLLSATVTAAQDLPEALRSSPLPGRFVDASSGPDGHGLDSGVTSMVEAADGSVYVAGYFTTADGTPLNGVARWTGERFEPLGLGLTGRFGSSYGLPQIRLAPDGDVLASSDFTTAGEVAARGLARWDGTRWQAFPPPPGVSREGVSLAIAPDGTVYRSAQWYGGIYNAATGLDRWAPDGTHTPLPVPRGRITSVVVTADGSLVIGLGKGRSSLAPDPALSTVLRWADSLWVPLGDGLRGDVNVLKLGADGQTIYAGGCFTQSGNASVPRLARWDGTAWQTLHGGAEACITDLDVFPDGRVVRVRQAEPFSTSGYVDTWTGGAWETLTPPLSNATVLAARSGDLFVGGSFWQLGDLPTAMLARYDGTRWHGFGIGTNGMIRTLGTGTDGTVYADGLFTTLGGQIAPSPARRTASGWETMRPTPFAAINGFVPDEDGSVIAFGRSAESPSAAIVARWDGGLWQKIGSDVDGLSGWSLRTLLRQPDGTLFAISGTIRRWTGEAWERDYRRGLGLPHVATLDPDGRLVVGNTAVHGPDGQTTIGLARLDGDDWTAPFPNVLGEVRALAFDAQGRLLVGGRLSRVGGLDVQRLARWDGTAWTDLGGPGLGRVEGLRVLSDGRLLVSGDFGEMGGVLARRVAIWDDGRGWSGLVPPFMSPGGSDSDLTVTEDADGSVLFGGRFTRVGDVYSPYLVRFVPDAIVAEAPAPDPASRRGLALGPNPARTSTALWFDADGGHATVDVFDALGRHVRTAFAGEAVGRTRIELPVTGLAPGVFAVRVASGGRVETARLVVVR